MADQHIQKKTKHRRSLFFPLLILSAGIFLMLNTMGLIPGNVSGILIRIWPVIFIAGGLDNLYQRNGYVGGVVSIGIGTVLLLDNLGYLTINAWDIALRFWPVLLIAWGLDLVVGKRKYWSAVIGIVLGLALMAGIGWLALNQGVLTGERTGADVQTFSQSLEKARSASVNLSTIAGLVQVAGGAKPANLVEGHISIQGIDHKQVYGVSGGEGSFTMKPGDGFSFTHITHSPEWDLRFNPDIPLSMAVSLVVGELDIDTGPLEIESLDGRVTVGLLDVTLPEEGDFRGNLENVIGQIIIRVPPGTALSINSDTVMTAVSYPEDFHRTGDLILAPGAENDSDSIHLYIDQVIGSLRIEYTE
jgi:hypothetical protein